MKYSQFKLNQFEITTGRHLTAFEHDMLIQDVWHRVHYPTFAAELARLSAEFDQILSQLEMRPLEVAHRYADFSIKQTMMAWLSERNVPEWVIKAHDFFPKVEVDEPNGRLLLSIPDILKASSFPNWPKEMITTWPGFDDRWSIYYHAMHMGIRLRAGARPQS